MIAAPIFDYKTPFVLNALADGEHKSKRQGLGSDFYKKSPFLSEPNPARLDLARSLTDPFESLYVKSYRQRSQLNVLTLIDGSSSMTMTNKPELISEYESSIANSVSARSDNYAAYLLSTQIKTVSKNELIDAHFSQIDKNDVAAAFDDLERVLPEQRSMIFVVSDFHWSEKVIKRVFRKLSGHYLVPIVLWCSAEHNAYKLWRFVQIQDAETGENRLIFVTPKQKQLIDNEFVARKTHLNHIFQQFACRPLWVVDEFNINKLRAFFHGA